MFTFSFCFPLLHYTHSPSLSPTDVTTHRRPVDVAGSEEAAGFQFPSSESHHHHQPGFRFADFVAASGSVGEFDT
ncbi:hypothetical protein HanRHA438_Chr07g0296951 [Helianthus annuus]|nr:hypothetical protein HanRHA438_Chr07g0296951 [Helianthus annuus]